MSDIVKGILDGGWALLVGWILPAALNVLVFALVVYPTVHDVPPFSEFPVNLATLVASAVVAGVISSALQTPLYRILEGYVWPTWLFRWGQRRQVKRRERLKQIVNFAGYSDAKAGMDKARQRTASVEHDDTVNPVQANSDLQRATENFDRWVAAGREAKVWLSEPNNVRPKFWHLRTPTSGEQNEGRGPITRVWARRLRQNSVVGWAGAIPRLQRQALAERLERYPVDEEQILPTALGNAIRRFERFGPVHYGLDQQRLWYELIAVAPEPVGKQVSQMRTAVDFFVSLFFGQVVIAITATIVLYPDENRRAELGIGILVAALLAALAYRGAIVATDEWALSVQALLNLGRKPLAAALSLELPRKLEEEQYLWRSLGQFLGAKPRSGVFARLDRYRTASGAPDGSDGA